LAFPNRPQVFLTGAFEPDLNETNPLGMKGELARAFGRLVSQLWRGGVGAVVPRGFKSRLASFAPQFSGYQQHDSQEVGAGPACLAVCAFRFPPCTDRLFALIANKASNRQSPPPTANRFYNPQFLAFLLDGLHEDINRIRVKPYVEERDAGGRPDAEVAAEAWANYRLRNDSAVVDHFQVRGGAACLFSLLGLWHPGA
jgi:ubiquitin C-terminal hydrolase